MLNSLIIYSGWSFVYVRDRACIKNWLFCLFYRAWSCVLGLFSFCNFFHGMQRNNVNLQLLYRRYWQLFKYMYHVNANHFKLVSLSLLNYKKFNNSYNHLTDWVSLAWFVISLYQASIVKHNSKYISKRDTLNESCQAYPFPVQY